MSEPRLLWGSTVGYKEGAQNPALEVGGSLVEGSLSLEHEGKEGKAGGGQDQGCVTAGRNSTEHRTAQSAGEIKMSPGK